MRDSDRYADPDPQLDRIVDVPDPVAVKVIAEAKEIVLTYRARCARMRSEHEQAAKFWSEEHERVTAFLVEDQLSSAREEVSDAEAVELAPPRRRW